MTENNRIPEFCLDNAPWGILILDSTGAVRQLNPALESMLGLKAEDLVGKRLDTLEDPAHACLFGDEELIHIATAGVVPERWLQCQVREYPDVASVRFYTDVSETVALREARERLAHQVEELTITDELTGLANQRALTRALNSQVTRSRRYNNPLSLAVVKLIDPDHPNEPLDGALILTTSRYLRDRLRWVDTIARWNDDQFVIILPETGIRESSSLIEKVKDEFDQLQLPQGFENAQLKLEFGLAEWEKGFDARRLMERASQALNLTAEAVS